MGGPGSGHGIKRPDHSKNSGNPHGDGFRKNPLPQLKHQKSLFSDKLDPSCHADKIKRDRLAGIPEDPLAAEKKEQLRMEYKEMQRQAQRRAAKVFKMVDTVLDNPDAPDSAKMQAANFIMDRAYGKAATINLNVDATAESNLAEMTDDQILREARTLVQAYKREGVEGESTEKPTDIRKYN